MALPSWLFPGCPCEQVTWGRGAVAPPTSLHTHTHTHFQSASPLPHSAQQGKGPRAEALRSASAAATRQDLLHGALPPNGTMSAAEVFLIYKCFTPGKFPFKI